MALAASTASSTGSACTIWPVSSKASRAVEMVWVTAPEKAAAPAVGRMWDEKGMKGDGWVNSV